MLGFRAAPFRLKWLKCIDLLSALGIPINLAKPKVAYAACTSYFPKAKLLVSLRDHLRCPISASLRRTPFSSLPAEARLMIWLRQMAEKEGLVRQMPHRCAITCGAPSPLRYVELRSHPCPLKRDSWFGCAKWRRRRDSNPRYRFQYNWFRVSHIRPLCHFSLSSLKMLLNAIASFCEQRIYIIVYSLLYECAVD